MGLLKVFGILNLEQQSLLIIKNMEEYRISHTVLKILLTGNTLRFSIFIQFD